MKKRTKIILICTIAAAFVIVCGVIALPYIWDSVRQAENKTLTPLDTGEVIPGVYVIRETDDIANLYLVKTPEDNYIAIDAGRNPEKVRSEIKKIGIDPADVVAVFLTHSDDDHASGLPAFSNAVIYLHEKEVQMIDGTAKRSILGYNKWPDGVAYIAVAGNVTEKIMIGGIEVQGYLTAGHTPGSTCWKIENMLFTGDNMSLSDGKAHLFNSLYNMDDHHQIADVNALLKEIDFFANFADEPEVKYLFTAHYGYTDDAGAALNGGLKR